MPKGKKGYKERRLLDYLNAERIGDELMLTPVMVRTIADKLNTPKEYVYEMLRKFASLKVITRHKETGTSGFVIRFESKKVAPEQPREIRDLTLNELIAKLESDILELDVETANLRNKIAEIESVITTKREKRDKLVEFKKELS